MRYALLLLSVLILSAKASAQTTWKLDESRLYVTLKYPSSWTYEDGPDQATASSTETKSGPDRPKYVYYIDGDVSANELKKYAEEYFEDLLDDGGIEKLKLTETSIGGKTAYKAAFLFDDNSYILFYFFEHHGDFIVLYFKDDASTFDQNNTKYFSYIISTIEFRAIKWSRLTSSDLKVSYEAPYSWASIVNYTIGMNANSSNDMERVNRPKVTYKIVGQLNDASKSALYDKGRKYCFETFNTDNVNYMNGLVETTIGGKIAYTGNFIEDSGNLTEWQIYCFVHKGNFIVMTFEDHTNTFRSSERKFFDHILTSIKFE